MASHDTVLMRRNTRPDSVTGQTDFFSSRVWRDVRERDSLVASTSGRAVRPPGRRWRRGVHWYVTLTEVEPASDRLPSWGCDKGKPGESRRRKATRLPSA